MADENIEGEPAILEEEPQAGNDNPSNEEGTGNPENPEGENPENQSEVKEALREVETLQAQKDHWRTKAQKLEEQLKKVKPQPIVSDDEFRPRVEFLLENRDLDAAEYDHLATVAQRQSGKITLDALREAKKSEAEYISYLRKKAESKRKIPGSTSAGGMSKATKSYEELSKMTAQQLQTYENQLNREQNSGI